MSFNDPHWVSDTAMEALNLERSVHPNETSEDMARRIFKEHLPIAAQRIVHIALNSPNEKVALDASKYVVERVMGKLGAPDTGAEDPLQAFLDDVSSKVEAYANGNV